MKKIILNKERDILFFGNDKATGGKVICKIFGLTTVCYTLGSNPFNMIFISDEALTFCIYRGYDLSNRDGIKKAIADKNIIGTDYMKLHKYFAGQWSKMLDYMINYENLPEAESQSKIVQIDNKNLALNENYNQSNTNSNESESFEEGQILISGIDRVLKYHSDKISLEAIKSKGGLMGLLDQTTNIRDENIYYEDIRSVSLWEGRSITGVVFTQLFGADTTMEAIPYLRFEIRGVDDKKYSIPNLHPYTIVITHEQIPEAKLLKEKIELIIQNLKKENSNKGNNNNYNINQISSADELMKYAMLLEKGLITQEEFSNIKKKLLGI